MKILGKGYEIMLKYFKLDVRYSCLSKVWSINQSGENTISMNWWRNHRPEIGQKWKQNSIKKDINDAEIKSKIINVGRLIENSLWGVMWNSDIGKERKLRLYHILIKIILL